MNTKIEVKECTSSDHDRNEWIQTIYNAGHYYHPYYCFNNTEDVFVTGSAAVSYDEEPRGFIKMRIRECRTADHCEKDPVKRRKVINELIFVMAQFEDQIDFTNHNGTDPTISFRGYTIIHYFNDYDT